MDFIQQLGTTSSVVGLRRSPKELPKAKLAPKKKGHGHCLVLCCRSDSQQLPESWKSHDIWEIYSASRWNAPKAAKPIAGIGQQKRHNFSARQCLTVCLTASTSKVEWIGLQNFDSFSIFTWPLANYHFLKSLHNQQDAKNAYQEFMVSWRIDFYATELNKHLFLAKMCSL